MQWVVEERFTRDEKVIGRFYVGPDGLLEAIDLENEKGEMARLRYDPPVPYQPAGMAIGETRAIATTLRIDSADFALPSKTVIERLADETVVAPAGEFTGCSHYRNATTSTIDIRIARIPITEERERWYHPAGGMIKEVYRRGPVKFLGWSRPGYTSASILTTYDRQEPKPEQQARVSDASTRREERERASQRPGVPRALWMRLILPAIILTGGGFILARRRRNR